jgi:hypothetical protein
MSNLFIMSLLSMTMTLSLGRVFGKGSLECNISLVGHFKEDPHYGYLKETTYHSGRLLLHVQEGRGICRSPSTPL